MPCRGLWTDLEARHALDLYIESIRKVWESEASDVLEKMYATLCAALEGTDWEKIRAVQAGLATWIAPKHAT